MKLGFAAGGLECRKKEIRKLVAALVAELRGDAPLSLVTVRCHLTLAKSLRGLLTEHILQVFMCVTMVSPNVHGPAPRNFNVVITATSMLPFGGVRTE